MNKSSMSQRTVSGFRKMSDRPDDNTNGPTRYDKPGGHTGVLGTEVKETKNRPK